MADDILEWPVRTAEYLHLELTASVNPLADDVKVALPAHRAAPEDSDYQDAEWVPAQTWVNADTPLAVRVFLDRDTLARGQRYDAWVQVTDSPEVPEIFAGVVKGV